MTYPWRSPLGTTVFYESASDISPLTPLRPKYRPPLEVPSGTVASRILELQNFAAKTCWSSRHLSPKVACLDHSRTGFGRRKNTRFGKPASRSTNPDGSDTTHSFVALRSSRSSHMEEHALIDGMTKWERSNGINGQLQPQGLSSRVQYDATSPAGIIPRRKYRDDGQAIGDVPLNNKCFNHKGDLYRQHKESVQGSKSVNLLSAAVPPSSPAGYYLDYKFRLEDDTSSPSKLPTKGLVCPLQDKLTERSTEESTPSVRKQSVKDLYAQYGIDRPSGLVSESDISPCQTQSNPPNEERPSFKSRIQPLKQDPHHRRRNIWSESKLDQNEYEAHLKTPASTKPSKRTCPGQVPIFSQRPISELSNFKKSTTKIDQPCDFNSRPHGEPQQLPASRSDNTTLPQKSQKSYPSYIELPPRQPPQLVSRSRTQSDRANLRSTTATKKLDSQTVRLIPVVVSNSSHDAKDVLYQHQNKNYQKVRRHYRSSSESEQQSGSDKYCDSPGCRATHSGHKPYRHSISCTIRRQSSLEQSENGSSAEEDTGSFQESKLKQRKCTRIPLFISKQEHETRNNPQDASLTTLRKGLGQRQTTNTHRADHEHASNSHRVHSKSSPPEQFLDSVDLLLKGSGHQGQQLPVNFTVQPPTRHETLATAVPQLKNGTVLDIEPSLKKESQCSPRAKLERSPLPANKNQYQLSNSSKIGPPPFVMGFSYSPLASGENNTSVLSSSDSKAIHINQVDQSTNIQQTVISPTSGLSPHGKPTTALSNDTLIKPSSGRSSALSRRVSAFFKIQGKNSASSLSNGLQEAQEEMQRLDNNSSTTGAKIKKGKEQAKVPELEQRLRQWKLKLTSKQPHREYANESTVSQHGLGHNDTVVPYPLEAPQHHMAECVGEALTEGKQYTEQAKNEKIRKGDLDHNCVWKRIVLENVNKQIVGASMTSSHEQDHVGILGVSVVIHLEGRQDVILKAPLEHGDTDTR